jgi:uncharacterized membrane protein/2-hydroxychromene-2-carboxylate isomerase
VKPDPWIAVVRAASFVALAASGALLADYTGPAPTYCGAGSGCAAVRHAGWGYVTLNEDIWIPVPALGALAFALLLGLTLFPYARVRRWVGGAAILGGLIAAWLIFVQVFVIKAICGLCFTADTAAIVAGVAGVFLVAKRESEESVLVEPWTWALLGALSFLAPWYWPTVRPLPAVPAEIQKLFLPGKINVVEFFDFHCPHCRALYPRLKKLNDEYGDRVHFVRMNRPLGTFSHARDSARAYVCADEQGKGELMADQLFTTKDQTPTGIAKLVEQLQLDSAKFKACIAADATERRIDRESAILDNAGFEGLPTTYVGSQKFIGQRQEETFRAAYERAGRTSDHGIAGPLYVVLSLGVGIGLIFAGRKRKSDGKPVTETPADAA